MVDYVKLLVQDADIKKLLTSEDLDFKGDYSISTGEVGDKEVNAEYHFCKITIYKSGRVLFTGSIHKMWNSLNNVIAPNNDKDKAYNGYNGNLYHRFEIVETVKHISNLLDCTPQQLIIQNIEIGVNTTPGFNPQFFIDWLLMHHGVGFEIRYKGRYAQATHERYYLKIYNKSEQYGIGVHTLRVELKIRKTQDFKRCAITTMADISYRTLENCKNLLLDQFKKVLYYDTTIRKTELSRVQIRNLDKYSNLKYWINELTPNHRGRPKQKLNLLILDYSDNLKGTIADEIIQKCVIINRPSKEAKCVIINHSSIGLSITQQTRRICPITREDISMQKEGSFLLSNTGLKHLEKHNPEKFRNLVQKLLTGKPNRYENDIYHRLSKQIRNRFYNNPEIPEQQKLFTQ